MGGVIGGGECWKEIGEFGKSKLELLKKGLEGLESIGRDERLNGLFCMFDGKGFEEMLRKWVREIVGEVKGVVGIDGKVMGG